MLPARYVFILITLLIHSPERYSLWNMLHHKVAVDKTRVSANTEFRHRPHFETVFPGVETPDIPVVGIFPIPVFRSHLVCFEARGERGHGNKNHIAVDFGHRFEMNLVQRGPEVAFTVGVP